MMEKQIWNILNCCKCGRYVDKETRKIVPKPADGIVMSHTYCDDCKEKAMQEIRTVATEELVKRAVRPKPFDPELSDRVREKTLDHYQRQRDELEAEARKAGAKQRIMADRGLRYGLPERRGNKRPKTPL